MKKFTATILLNLVLNLTYSQSYSKCKIFCTDLQLQELNNLGITIDHGIHKKNTFYISDFSSDEIQKIMQNGYQIEILIEDVQAYYSNQNRSEISRNPSCNEQNTSLTPKIPSNFTLGSMGGFYTYEEFLAQLDLMKSIYPELITSKEPISDFQTHQGRPIYWVKISDNASIDENEAEVLYTSIHHSREPASLSNTIFYMWYLLENYNSNPEIKYLVDQTEMYFVPMINPDGYVHNQTTNPSGGGMWRKNRRNNNNGTFGVDLNRNYSYDWGTTGVSFDTNSDVYPGTEPFSEPETQAIKWFCEQRDFLYAFNAHTYSNLILFPIGSQIDVFADDHDYFLSIASNMVQYNGYLAQKSTDLYPASGDSDDYMYASDLTIKPKIFAFTPEIGSSEDGFWPTQNRIIPLCQEMIHSNLVLAHAAHNYWEVKQIDPNNLVTSDGFFNIYSKRLGLSELPLILAIEPLSGIQTIDPPKSISAALNESNTSQFSYTLNNNLQLGEEIKYVLTINYTNYIKRDTITKYFGYPSLQVVEDGNSIENWTGTWALTSEDYVSPNHSFTDSPNIKYSNNTHKTLTYFPIIDLTNVSSAKIEFWAKWSIENNYDYASFEVSTNNGLSWSPQCGKYTNLGTNANQSVQPNGKPIYDGVQNDWVLEEISLDDYLGQEIKIRFVLRSDGGVTDEGFFFRRLENLL
jgi:carboxypeptidase T